MLVLGGLAYLRAGDVPAQVASSSTASSTTATSPSPTPTPSTSLPSASAGTVSPTSSAAVTAQPSSAPRSLKGRVIVIDPGHNGNDYAHPEVINKLVDIVNGRKACEATGTQTNAGYAEHAFTWDLADRLATVLRAAGATVVLTRPDDHGVGPCITERAAIGNRAHADLAISLHADGGPSTGVGFHVIEPGPVGPNDAVVAPSARLGREVRDAFRDGTGEPYANYIAHNGIAVRTDLGGLNLSLVPKVFIECGNMRNATDAARLTRSSWRQRAAESIAAGMAAYLTAH